MIECVILMCAGKAERWGKHLGVDKHLIIVDGETLLDRTIRLVRMSTSAQIVIVAFNSAYTREGCERFEPRHGPSNFCDTDKFLSAVERWGEIGQTVILYGDVFFTNDAMNQILSHEGPHCFFGRREKSYVTGRPWKEMFALSFPANERDEIRNQMEKLRADLIGQKVQRGGGWELFRQMHGFTWDRFVAIDDFTDDFDYPADYEKWNRRFRNPVHRAIAPLYSAAAKRCAWWLGRCRRYFAAR